MFNLEYLHEGDQHCPLIRLYDYDPSDVVALGDLCLALADGRSRKVSLDSQAWVRAIVGCQLVMLTGDSNRGVRTGRAENQFVMEYATEGWLEIAEKLSPFAAGSGGYQWLTNEGDVNVLISRDGYW